MTCHGRVIPPRFSVNSVQQEYLCYTPVSFKVTAVADLPLEFILRRKQVSENKKLLSGPSISDYFDAIGNRWAWKFPPSIRPSIVCIVLKLFKAAEHMTQYLNVWFHSFLRSVILIKWSACFVNKQGSVGYWGSLLGFLLTEKNNTQQRL